MLKPNKFLLGALFVIFSTPNLFAFTLIENQNYLFSLNVYFRQDLVGFKNVVDLDSENKNDSTVYTGIDYNLGLAYENKNTAQKIYLKLERNGPYDYDAPIFVHNTLQTSGGEIKRYKNDELLPQIEEFWWDQPLFSGYGVKAGLYSYEVGNGFALNGSYENYGITFYRQTQDLSWRIYYCRPEIVYKNRLGPHISQDEDQGIRYNHNASNFFAADLIWTKDKNTFQPYVGVLSDYTSALKRDNYFTTPVKRDLLGTYGLSWQLKEKKFYVKSEAAHNFGQAKSASPDYKDISHTGYLGFADAGCYLGKLTPSFKFLFASGNKATLDMASNQDATFSGSKNRAFSASSPLNNHLVDSICNCHSDLRPLVAMGNGYGLNYGVPRPGTFSASDFDNLILFSPGFNIAVTEKFNIGLYWYNLYSFTRGVGTLDGQAKFLSRDLGKEMDFFADYRINKNMLISLSAGYFIPGKYYKELRDDTEGSIFSPYVRGDGSADAAYQFELSMELEF